MKSKVYFKTFGCRTNIYDTGVMQQNLKSYDITQNEDEADIVVVNSCTVTNTADGSARGYINSLNRKGKKVVLAGCGAFSQGEELFKKGSVSGVFGHSEKSNIDSLLQLDKPFFKLGDLDSLDDTIVEDFSSKTKAFIKIQEGCNFECSYCIIPSVRGTARSQDEQKILDQIVKLAQNGFGEFVLTGTNIGSYGRDTGSSLAKLLKRISLINGVKRVRLGSIEPVQIDDEFIELLDENWLEKHLHIALQHTNEQMLRLMRRRNSLKKDLELFERISQKGFALGTDFIVGHPGESEKLWLDGLKNFKKFPLTHIHAFRYSPREGMHSTTLKNQVSGDIAKKRLGILQDIVTKNSFEFRERQKSQLLVLVEDKKNFFQVGYDQFYNKILIQSSKNLQKEWIFIEDYEVGADANFTKIV